MEGIWESEGEGEVQIFVEKLIGDGSTDVDIPIDCLEGLIETGHFDQAEYLIMHHYLIKKIGKPTHHPPNHHIYTRNRCERRRQTCDRENEERPD